MDEKHFRLLAEYALDLICLVNADLVMTYASPSCERLLGWKPEEMTQKGPDSFVHPSDLHKVAAAHRLLEERGADRSPTVVRMRKKSGDYAWMEVNARMIRGTVGNSYQVVLIMRDISSRVEKGTPQNVHISPPIPLKTDDVISGADLYITESGHVAFVESIRQSSDGETLFSGHVLDGSSKKALEWLSSGECITDGEGHHRVKSRI